MFLGTFNVLTLPLTACDHDFILNKIRQHIKKKSNFLISPIASQTFVLAIFDKKLREILNSYDYLFSDSIWVKRSINFLFRIGLRERIRGSNFLLRVCELAEKEKYKVFLYGTTNNTLSKLKFKLRGKYPNLKIAGAIPSKFAPLTYHEKKELISQIEKSKANILCIALGSPLEQIFSYDLLYTKPNLKHPLVIIPFGAAFDFVSGIKPAAPVWMQNLGIEWFYRLLQEPRRLWKRYLILGPLFVFFIIIQKILILLKFSNYIIREGEIG